MSDTIGFENINSSNSSLYNILRNCVNLQSYDSLPIEDYSDVCAAGYDVPYKMITANHIYATSGNISSTSSSYVSESESFGDNILEENGRISLAYENLRTIPRRIAEKFAAQTKCLDLSYNNFQNLSFLSFFDELHTLILDRNSRLDVNTFPFLPCLKILWINNCEIANVTNWIQRIQLQCPGLEHLSIMGNPGIKHIFKYCVVSQAHSMLTEPLFPMSNVTATDYREYICHMLPQLQILDGIVHCNAAAAPALCQKSSNSSNGQRSSSSSMANGSPTAVTVAGQAVLNGNGRKTTPSLSFKDIFRLKRRKKSLPSSTTTTTN